jgi:hypothetical protein
VASCGEGYPSSWLGIERQACEGSVESAWGRSAYLRFDIHSQWGPDRSVVAQLTV